MVVFLYLYFVFGCGDQLFAGGFDFKENLAECFSDFLPYLNGCKFNSCSHTKEKGCLICEAVVNGKIEKTRHESYVTIFNELKSLNSWDKK